LHQKGDLKAQVNKNRTKEVKLSTKKVNLRRKIVEYLEKNAFMAQKTVCRNWANFLSQAELLWIEFSKLIINNPNMDTKPDTQY
jgi:hypothetical protein